MLVVVKDRNLHSFAQLGLDVKTLRCFDIFEVDAAKSRLQRRNDVDQFIRIVFGNFNVEHINAGELLEQHAFAFHHRFSRQRPDIAKAQDRRAISDHSNQIGTRGVQSCRAWIADYFIACRGHPRRIGQRQIRLIGQRLGRRDGNFSRRWQAVIIQRCGANTFIHSVS